jgi:hypothetical protein
MSKKRREGTIIFNSAWNKTYSKKAHGKIGESAKVRFVQAEYKNEGYLPARQELQDDGSWKTNAVVLDGKWRQIGRETKDPALLAYSKIAKGSNKRLEIGQTKDATVLASRKIAK